MANLCRRCWNKGRHLVEGCCFCTGDVKPFKAPYFNDNPMINWTPLKREGPKPTTKRGKR